MIKHVEQLLARAVEGVETKDLRSLVDDGKKQIGSGMVAIVGSPRTARPANWLTETIDRGHRSG